MFTLGNRRRLIVLNSLIHQSIRKSSCPRFNRCVPIQFIAVFGILLITAAFPAFARTATEAAKLLAGDGVASDEFGWSVSVSGDTAVIGALADDDNDAESGSASVFVRDGAGNWTPQAKLLAGDGAAFDYFGSSVSVSGDTAVIGAYGDNDNGFHSGSAYIVPERKAFFLKKICRPSPKFSRKFFSFG